MKFTAKEQVHWRLFTLIALSALFTLMGQALLARDVDINKRIQLSSRTLTVEQLLGELSDKYAINFSYNNNEIPLKQTVVFKNTSLSLQEILKQLSANASINYSVYTDLIILNKNKPRASYTISGYIEDSSSGEKLLGANVYTKDDLAGTTTNTYGFYSITLAEGPVKLVASFVGFQQFEQVIDLTSDRTLSIKLEPSIEIDEVIVRGESGEYSTRSQLSIMKVTSKEVEQIPALLGEVDVLKTMQLLPGVQTGAEGSSGMIVRGGSADQNLIILDGVPVYNVNHLLGFVSVFNSNSIKDVSLYKSGFPARYGGRASAVVDITMKEGNNKKLTGEGSIGIISSKFTLEGPIKNENTSFIISGRRTYLDLPAKPFLTKKEGGRTVTYGYYFYDLNTKVNHRFSDKSRLYLSAYMGNDVFSYNEEDKNERTELLNNYGLKWGNITTSLRWNYMLSNKLFANTTLAYSNYRFMMGSEYTTTEKDGTKVEKNHQSQEFLNGIYDGSAKVDFDYFPNQSHSIKFGVGYCNHTFVPSSYTKVKDPGRDTSSTVRIYGKESFAYLEDDMSIGQKVNVNVGFHYSFFSAKNKDYFHLQPRVSVNYSPWTSVAFKASYSKMVQYLQTNSFSSIPLPVDLWIPSTDSIKPVESHNYALGIDIQPTNKYNYGVEGFYRTMHNVLAFKEGSAPVPDFLNDMVQGEGWAYGVEFLIKKNVGKTTGWLGYTWSNAWRQFDSISFGEKYPYKYDRRHDISLVVMHKFNDRVDLSGAWVFGTGNAMSLSTEKYVTNFTLEDRSQSTVISSDKTHIQKYEHRNNYRMPRYHRMDIGVNFHKQKKRITRTWSFGAYNVYNKKNPLWLQWETSDTDPNKSNLVQYSLFGIIPYITYSFKF